MSDTTLEEIIQNTQAELASAILMNDLPHIANLEAYLDDLYNEQYEDAA
ncbi:MAG: hypothetical protein KAH32_01105 [Chlamydiia bacterium]|nr:hypothetical protein [Chlamydiia bacterium]